ncbi:YihY/virulence factor BrkB family protein [Clostridium saccharobutylicum]|uniref:Putative ribonuclease-like protein YfkH n=1 Tax=Clostridium saccharobutylicum DSM 13864 TaxID=1345695 RepID=U5N025_CLOSA|nr:YihY/virulence factor BrkB family protein [Clostridium saccharobutylicum]AGX45281.1 putative ribonuclease-like protein YfkH [Clostridium saccharobutylicum DSM 13864]AQR92556.1 hypothetical protein CLOSC_42860 [Clostridium saccharobutylicum]AQS02458.1 hypothetical protein CSACC_42910 [Clostridium saccharobutylicum]AQS16441.1 hypothetical protein CLOSACC_42910 [Clostridium saccharobutylicum]MBA2906846.1 membrane protein [Clostridium saccharobutylicum]
MNKIKSKIRRQINLLIHLIIKIKNDDIFALASQLAYYLMLSFFPFILFLMTLVGFSSLSSVDILNGVNGILPKSVVDLTRSTITEVFDNQYKGLLWLSILLMIWTSSTGFKAVIKGVNKAYNFKENRSFIKISIISMLGILSIAMIILLALVMLVFGGVIADYMRKMLPVYYVIVVVWNAFRYAFVFIVMIFIFAAIYRIAPAKKLTWNEVIPGAVFSTIGWILISFGFSFYINRFTNYSRFYGSLGAVFILMTWLFLVSMIFILGVEINFVTDQINDSSNLLD